MRDVYSVWNWEKGHYDYYRGVRPRPYRARIGYPRAGSLTGVGALAEESVHPVPAGAEYIGSGEPAVGTIASAKQRSPWVFAAVALAGLWWLR